MARLYIRDVPEPVAESLKERAAEACLSLSAYVARELADIAARPTNAETVKRLKSRDRSQGPSTADILDALQGSIHAPHPLYTCDAKLDGGGHHADVQVFPRR